MLYYVPIDPGELAGKDWIWIERPNGSRYMVFAAGKEIAIPAKAVHALVRQVECTREAASGF